MIIVLFAYLLYSGAIIYRTRFCSPEIAISNYRFYSPLLLCIACDCIAAFGFSALFKGIPAESGQYSPVLTILSLLAAGVIAGKFSFSHHETSSDEKWLTSSLYLLIVLLFYVIFGAVSYYAGLTKSVSAAPGIQVIIPLIMAIILIANTIEDYWDYLERDED